MARQQQQQRPQQSKPASAPVRRDGPSLAKQRRTEAQKLRQDLNRERRRAREPLPWELACQERQRRHGLAVASGSWEAVQRTELGMLVRIRAGSVCLEDPGWRDRRKYLELHSGKDAEWVRIVTEPVSSRASRPTRR